jgi:hypothetical protein
MIFCYRGKSSGPPESLRRGEILLDGEGRRWAYTGECQDGSRDGAIFVIDQERAGHGLPNCSPQPATLPAESARNNEKCLSTVYCYRQDLRVIRYDYKSDKKKDFQPQFFFNDRWNAGAGSEIWPFYGSLDSSSDFALEVEGEKCVDTLRSVGIASVTHPGHQRDESSCRARYEGLVAVGIKKVYFISDNDAAGRKKAAGFAIAAQLAQLELIAIPAESICEVPEGGSVDDMPIEQLPSMIAAAVKSASGARPAPLSRVSFSKIKKALQELQESEVTSAAEISESIASIANAHDVSVIDAKRIWDSLEEDRRTEEEALSAGTAILRRQELEDRRKSIELDDYLPEEICGAVRVLTGNLPCDPLTAIAVVLTTAAGVFRAGHRIDAGDALFVKEPVIWTLISGNSGSGKSPIMRHLSKDRLRLVIEHYNQLSTAAETEYQLKYGHLPKNVRPDKPEPYRTCLSNFTTEKLNGILSDNHTKGLGTFIYSEEVRSILGNFDEYKSKGKGRGKETFLCLFDGNVDPEYRVGRSSRMVTGKVQNSLLGAVQPGVFRRMVEEGDDAGLFARCLMVPLINEYVEPNFFRSPEEIVVVHAAEKSLENFYLRCLGLAPLVLRLDREAVELFAHLSRDTFDKSQMVSLESQRAVLGKRLGYILQITIAIHLCRVAAGEKDREELYISKGSLARSVILVDLLQSYAIVEQQESQMQRHGALDLNKRIHTFAKGNGGCTASTFLSRCIPMRYRSSVNTSHVRSAMDQLVATGLGEWQMKGKKQTFVSLGRFPD